MYCYKMMRKKRRMEKTEAGDDSSCDQSVCLRIHSQRVCLHCNCRSVMHSVYEHVQNYVCVYIFCNFYKY